MQNDEQAIRDLVEQWSAASMAGKVEEVLELVAEDAVFHVAGREPYGKEAFAQSFRQGLEHVRLEIRSEITELEVVGNLAYMRNHLRVTITPRGGGMPMNRAGYAMTILRKLPEGKWVLSRDANLLTPEVAV
ncbi:SgcJ/EcaC family oxidoreductase [Alloacidobacterium dinghuense]|uniref:SgcJ/EcaC family oxidoreductase n=1 Tax=Alloacidobacterium dinghuense TaxID=2763107 RepID=A0A7G8BLG0_9BACT|nr:SgcJ/EcaC family oxidoreductase [Alloacidobacterium dinghuense]QNI33380.1 SgcJ/EcaC family oxidoreductase [Alloacidobacterium dinghuense]